MSAEPETLEEHYGYVAEALRRGRVVPLLGAGVNLSDPRRNGWQLGENLPASSELSQYIGDMCHYPDEDRRDLLRVAQYAKAKRGDGPLYDQLRDIFAALYGYTCVHAFLAHLPGTLEAAGGARRHQLIITTNYDDALEQALTAALEPFDLVWYSTHPRETQGKFFYKPFGGDPELIECPDQYDVPVGDRTVVLKIHGAVSRADLNYDSYVISEDDYLRFLMHTDLDELIPASLLAALVNSHILFLGYSLEDWNLRVILHQVASKRDLSRDSWAIQKNVRQVDRALWDWRQVRLHDIALDTYVAELAKRMFG